MSTDLDWYYWFGKKDMKNWFIFFRSRFGDWKRMKESVPESVGVRAVPVSIEV